MRYNNLSDIKNIAELSKLEGTAYYSETAFCILRIRATDDGDKVFIQNVVNGKPEEINMEGIEYYKPTPLILDILNMDEKEFEGEYGELVPGFVYNNALYLLSEFVRDSYER